MSKSIVSVHDLWYALGRMNQEKDILVIENLVKKYGNKTAVDNVSLRVPRGSFFGLLGPNGAGKSSIIHCITGIGKITSGRITVDGIDVEKEYKEARRKVGLSPQEFNVDIFAPVDKLLDYVGGYYGMPKVERQARIDELIERFELTEHRSKRFRELSGGLKRRAILARALVHTPDLLILDEPTAGVDVQQRHDLWNYLREMNKRGKTIILTSHYLEEIEALCNEIAVINNGSIVAHDSKESFTKDDTLENTYLRITKGAAY